jgi:NADH-quinone oxidoreductase subunit N
VNASIIWIIMPATLSLASLFLRRKNVLLLIAGVLVSALLGVLAVAIPSGGEIGLGLVHIPIDGNLIVLGRRFILDAGLRKLAGLIYLGVAFWFGGAYFAGVSSLIVPFGLGIAASSVAALAIEPFLYAPLFIEVAVLLGVPFFVPIGKAAGRGIIRYIVFQTLGIPFIMLAGWMLTDISAQTISSEVVLRLGVILGLGFAFLMAIFPLHSWIPMLADEVHPYVLSFSYFFLPLITTLFGLKLLNRYPWIFTSTAVAPSLVMVVGAIMALIGGVWTAFQRNLARMMSFSLVTDIGLVLLMLGAEVQGQPGASAAPFILALLVSRGLSFLVWALSLSTLTGSVYGEPLVGFSFREVQGAAKRYPISAAGIVLAHLSLAGFPLLAGFPVRLGSFNLLLSISPWASIVAMIASVGMMIGALRTTAVLVMGEDENRLDVNETPAQGAAIFIGMAVIILMGVVPHWFIEIMTRVGDYFMITVR